jgi:hypothetical protein
MHGAGIGFSGLRGYFEYRAEAVNASICRYAVEIARRVEYQTSKWSITIASFTAEGVENLLLSRGAKFEHCALPVEAARECGPV